MDVREALAVVASGGTLTRDQARGAMGAVMAGEATPAQLGALLAALHVRGETVDEIAGFATALRAAAVPVDLEDGAIDTCGTGGDRSNSFNISTVSAIVAAAAGARVAKHGNRAASSACGSADVLEALGVRIDLGPEAVSACVRETGLGFMFAPRFHPAMRHAAPVRREIGIRTVFNVLGPLANPAGVRRQLLGVPSPAFGATIARVLGELGATHALVVHGADGLDEISPSGPTRVWELRDGRVDEWTLAPAAVGLEAAGRERIAGGDAARNAEIAREVLSGGGDGARTAVLLNAGAACYVAGLAGDVREGVATAARALDTGAASDTLARFVAASRRLGEGDA
ncbi:MAG: anthranilate phosphoribosyltransferase [Candidatus Limnocylindria bacterium]